MANPNNTFPLVLSIKSDGSVDAAMTAFESNIRRRVDQAGGYLDRLTRQVGKFRDEASRGIADPFGIKAQIASLSTAPLQRAINEQASASNALAQQRLRAQAEIAAAQQRQIDAALAGVRAEAAARSAAFAKAESEGNRLNELAKQRVTEAAAYLAGPSSTGFTFDPGARRRDADAARAQAIELERIAVAAAKARDGAAQATVADHSLATASREAADAAKNQADRLDEVALAEARVHREMNDGVEAINRQVGASKSLALLRKQTAIYTASDVVASLGSGASPFTVLLQQGPQVLQTFALQERGLRGILDVLTPTRLAVGGLAATTLLGAKAWLDYRQSMAGAEALAQGIGAVAGLTGTQLLAAAAAGAQAGDITRAAARELEQTYVATGKIGEEALGQLIGVTRDYAAATGTDMAGAAKDLATAFANPAAGAETLTAKLGILDQAGLSYIQTLTEQNRTTDAQTALLNALGSAMEGAASHTTVLEQGFLNIKLAASEAFEAIGRAIDRAAGGGAVLDKITDLQRERGRAASYGVTDLSSFDKQIDTLRYQLRQEQARTARAQANSRSAATAALVGKFNGQDELGELRRKQAQVRQTLSDPLQSLPAAERRQTVDYYNALTRAVQTYIPERQKEVRLAQIDQQLAAAKSPAARAALTARREQLALAGKVISAADADAIATANSARANVGAARAADAAAAAARRKAEAFSRGQSSAEEAVSRLAAKFDKQPTLVDDSAAAVRQLDGLIGRYGRLADATSKAIVERAKLARALAQAAPETQIGLATAELEDQLRITKLIAAGRDVEAGQLQDKLALLKRIGIEQGKETPTQRTAIDTYDAKRREVDRANFDARFSGDERSAATEAEAIRAEIAGRQEIADLIRAQAGYEAQGQKLSQEQLIALAQRLERQHQLTRELEVQAQLIGIQVSAAQDVQTALTNALTEPFKKGGLRAFTDALTGIRQRKVAAELSVKLLGDLGARVHDALTRNAAPLTNAADRHIVAATKWETVADLIARVYSGTPTAAQRATTPTAYGAAGAVAGEPGDIVVTGKRLPSDQIDGEPQSAQIARDAVRLATTSAATRQIFDDRLGTFLQRNNTVLTYAAQAIGGKGGAVISALQNTGVFKDIGSDIAKQVGGPLGKTLGSAAAGVGQGLVSDSIVKALGVKGSATGAAIGGEIGGAIAGPLGGYIGGALGSIVGGLFKKTKTGSATITSVDGAIGTSGNNAGLRAAASATAGAVQDQLQQIINSLGGTAGSFAVSIGQRKGNFVVDTSGSGRTKGSGTLSFKTEAEAAHAALLNAIQDGAVAGITAGAQRILQAGADLDRQLQKAVAFQDVFTQLKAIKDPVGAAVDALDKQFTYLRSVFAEASASTEEYSQLEELYALKRAEAIKAAAIDTTSALQSFLDDLLYKGDTGKSLKTRVAAAAAVFDPLAATVRAGGKVDQDKFAEAARTYLDLSRQLLGSTSAYFGRLSDITGLTGLAIRNAGGTPVGLNAATAANDNAALLAQQLYAAAGGSTIPDDRAAMFTQAQFTDAVSTALATTPVTIAPTTVVQPSNGDVVAAIGSLNDNLVNGFNLLIRTKAAAGGDGGGSGLFQGLDYTLRNA